MLGDYVDRGPKSKEVVEQIMQMHEQYNIIAIKGNHDAMMVKALSHDVEEYDNHWIRNGGLQTLASYAEVSLDDEQLDWEVYTEAKQWLRTHYEHHLRFWNSFPLYTKFLVISLYMPGLIRRWRIGGPSQSVTSFGFESRSIPDQPRSRRRWYSVIRQSKTCITSQVSGLIPVGTRLALMVDVLMVLD